VNQATEELPGLFAHQIRLPGRKLNRATMLRSWAVLREQADKVIRVDHRDDAPAPGIGLIEKHSVRAEDRLHRIDALPRDAWPPRIERDPQPPCATHSIDRPVAEIHPEEVAVAGPAQPS
jgi:hypothetical protein